MLESPVMLYYLAATLYVLSCLLLQLVVLLQQGKGGDMASAFGGGGSQTALGSRGAATVLSKATTISATSNTASTAGTSQGRRIAPSCGSQARRATLRAMNATNARAGGQRDSPMPISAASSACAGTTGAASPGEVTDLWSHRQSSRP